MFWIVYNCACNAFDRQCMVTGVCLEVGIEVCGWNLSEGVGGSDTNLRPGLMWLVGVCSV